VRADMTVFCIPPQGVLEGFREYAGCFRSGSVVTEICGVKGRVCKAAEALPAGVQYAGIHPMAGKEHSGIGNADGALFQGTGFLITPIASTEDKTVTLLEEMARYIGAARVVVSPAAQHDEIIAYSSDLMHAAAFGLCMERPDGFTMAHTAGAFRDCTRVAQSDPTLWAELFIENAQALLPQLDGLAGNLAAMGDAIRQGDKGGLEALLRAANRNKKEMQTR